MAYLDIETRETTEGVELLVSGELDLATVGTLQKCLAELDDSCRYVALDLAEVSFMDSAGVAELIRARQHAEPMMRAIVVRNPQPGVLRVLEMTGVGYLLSR